jgi:uncharacterized membrane protein YfbV (UPF0208 family)
MDVRKSSPQPCVNCFEVFLSSFFNVIRQGDCYLQTWPKQRVLNCLFIDSKIVFYTRLAIKLVPAFVFLIISLQIIFPLVISGSSMATFVLFLLGLPVQGLYWLGKRSKTLLPKQLLPWYSAVKEKLYGNRANPSATVMQYHPSYQDLASLLNQAFKIGGDKFLQHHELI